MSLRSWLAGTPCPGVSAQVFLELRETLENRLREVLCMVRNLEDENLRLKECLLAFVESVGKLSDDEVVILDQAKNLLEPKETES